MCASCALSCGDTGDARFGEPEALTCDSQACVAASSDSCASWRDEVFPSFVESCASAGCHAEGGIEPVIVTADASKSLDNLADYRRNNLPYVSPGGGRAYILCNLSGEACFGEPMPPSAGASDALYALVSRWVSCGMLDDSAGGAP